jgi:transposase InsO family protein
VLRIDNGGELCGNEFEELCKKCGIPRKNTTPYTPQQNGYTERMNRTLMEKEKIMLNGVELGHEFLVEVVDIACYLVNQSPSLVLFGKNLHEGWIGKNPLLNIS